MTPEEVADLLENGRVHQCRIYPPEGASTEPWDAFCILPMLPNTRRIFCFWPTSCNMIDQDFVYIYDHKEET